MSKLKNVLTEYTHAINRLVPYNLDVARVAWGNALFCHESNENKYRPTIVFTIRTMEDAQKFIDDLAKLLGRPMQQMTKRSLLYGGYRVFVSFEKDYHDWPYSGEFSIFYIVRTWYEDTFGHSMYRG